MEEGNSGRLGGKGILQGEVEEGQQMQPSACPCVSLPRLWLRLCPVVPGSSLILRGLVQARLQPAPLPAALRVPPGPGSPSL